MSHSHNPCEDVASRGFGPGEFRLDHQKAKINMILGDEEYFSQLQNAFSTGDINSIVEAIQKKRMSRAKDSVARIEAMRKD